MKFVICSSFMVALVFSFFAQAKKNTSVVTTSTTTTTTAVVPAESSDKKYQTMDLKQFDGLREQSSGIQLNANVNCKSSSGAEYKSGDVGYDQCVRASGKSGQYQNNEQKAENGMELNLGK